MNNLEFNKWFDSHSTAFPGLKPWLSKPENQNVLSAFAACLKDVTIEAAMDATAALNRGDVQTPMGFGDHARTVRKLAKEKPQFSRRIVGGEETVKCFECGDLGVIRIIHPSSVEAHLENKQNGLMYSCVARCKCDIGQRKFATSEQFKAANMPTFDERGWRRKGMTVPMIRYPDFGATPESLRTLVHEWEPDVSKLSGYDPSLQFGERAV